MFAEASQNNRNMNIYKDRQSTENKQQSNQVNNKIQIYTKPTSGKKEHLLLYAFESRGSNEVEDLVKIAINLLRRR